MGWCRTGFFVITTLVAVGLAFILYTPFPDYLSDKTNLQLFFAKFKANFIAVEIKHQLGFGKHIDLQREAFTYFSTPLRNEDRKVLKIWDTELDGIKVRIYKPMGARALLPAIVFYHGGGWIFLHIDNYDGVCGYIARQSQIMIISVEYGLGPEHPFPSGYNDGLKVILHVLQHGHTFGVDTSRVAVAGDSAGGNMAAAYSIQLRNKKVQPPLRAQLLFYGAYQMCHISLPVLKERSEYERKEFGLFMYAEMLRHWLNLTTTQRDLIISEKYLSPKTEKICKKLVDYRLLPSSLIPEKYQPDGHTALTVNTEVTRMDEYFTDSRIAPLMEEDLTNLPSTFVLAVGWDIFRDDNLIMAERLKKAGNKVELTFHKDTFHGIINFPFEESGFSAGERVYGDIFYFIKEHLLA